MPHPKGDRELTLGRETTPNTSSAGSCANEVESRLERIEASIEGLSASIAQLTALVQVNIREGSKATNDNVPRDSLATQTNRDDSSGLNSFSTIGQASLDLKALADHQRSDFTPGLSEASESLRSLSEAFNSITFDDQNTAVKHLRGKTAAFSIPKGQSVYVLMNSSF